MNKRSPLWGAGILLLSAMLDSPPAQADEIEERLRELESAYTELLIRDQQKTKLIEDLRSQIDDLQRGKRRPLAASDTGHDHGDGHPHDEEHGHGAGESDLFAVDVGGGTARLSGIFLDVSGAAGGSTETGEVLQELQFGDHDPDTNGFTLRTADVSFAGGFDPYFDAYANIAFFIDNEGETVVELEEAFLQTQAEAGFIPEIRAGQFFTEFGLYNPVHIHDHDWLDQPFVLSRILGPDGLRGQGARLAWRSAHVEPFTFLVGVQNAFGETQASFRSSDELFEELPIGGIDFVEQEVENAGDLTYHARLAKQFSIGASDVSLGVSALIGPNASGEDGRTLVGGIDLAFQRGFANGSALSLQGEFVYRDYDVDDSNPSGADDLTDYGFYAQALYDFGNDWSAGLRGEFASGDGESVGDFSGRNSDPFRSDRYRISPLVAWQFTPYSRVSLQYNYDNADFLDEGDAHAVWLGLDFSIGAGRRVELGNHGPAHAHGEAHGH